MPQSNGAHRRQPRQTPARSAAHSPRREELVDPLVWPAVGSDQERLIVAPIRGPYPVEQLAVLRGQRADGLLAMFEVVPESDPMPGPYAYRTKSERTGDDH